MPGASRAADPAEHEAALDLALLLADEDAAAGDFAQALHALDAAAALRGRRAARPRTPSGASAGCAELAAA